MEELHTVATQLTINLVALVVAFVAAHQMANSDQIVCHAVSIDHQSGGTGGSLCGSRDNRRDAPECVATAVGQSHHGCNGSPR